MRHWVRRIGAGLSSTSIVAVLSLAIPPAAVAMTPGVDACAAKSQESVVLNYRRGAVVMPLRCGSATWGFRHVVARLRWNERFDASIALTFSRGQEFHNGSTYALFDADCRERFRVKVNPRAFRGVEFRPQGIVTAYETNWPNSVGWTGNLADAGYRSDCKLFDRIRLQA
ncbi:hypothetical protein [Pseudonocardia endophytica]|uniref:Uncharacterized protein n=1 Tax=Pseudonocardia endophytica TaxID=401976 RepID=A0A4V2PJ05_PSEEN|nr:hypothetical protein [Pseudonocardia endophytica]TCK26666.1 hypothetical protein EV378_2507 [Pseudonocardia endophytica]